MANTDRPEGFRPHGKIGRAQVYQSGSAIGVGDMVIKASDGQVDPCQTSGNVYSAAVLGVALTSASASGQDVLVLDDPDQEYVCQADDGTIAAQTDLGLNAAILGTSASGGNSRQEIDASSIATTATLPLKIKGVAREINRNALGANVLCIVKINAHQSGSASDGV